MPRYKATDYMIGEEKNYRFKIKIILQEQVLNLSNFIYILQM